MSERADRPERPAEREVEVTSSGAVREVPPSSPEEIVADIEHQREELAETLDALAAKLDVKSHARDAVADVKDRATTDTGRPRTELLVAGGAVVVALVGVWWWRHRR